MVSSLMMAGCLVRGHQFDGVHTWPEHSKVSRALRKPESLEVVRESKPDRGDYILVEADAPDVTSLEIQDRLKPNFPLVMTMLGENGRVSLNFVVGPSGRAESIQVVEATNTYFADAAVQSLRNWSFKPAERAGVPVTVAATTTIEFTQPWASANAELGRLIFDLVTNRDYETLELLAERYRRNRDKLPDGRWRLERFYEVALQGLGADSFGWRNCDRVDRSLQEWREVQPDSATAVIMRAGFLFDCAWEIRGKGRSETVEVSAWPPFHALIQRSIRELEDGRSVAEHDPHFHVFYIKALGSSSARRNDFAHAVKDGLARAPDYLEVHRSAINYLLPKWGGSKAGTLAYIDRSVALTTKDYGNAFAAYDFYWAVQAEFEDVFLEEAKLHWDQIRDGITTWLAIFPSPENAEKFAYLSCRVGDVPMLSILLEMIGDGAPDMTIWHKRDYYNFCVDIGNLLDLDEVFEFFESDIDT